MNPRQQAEEQVGKLIQAAQSHPEKLEALMQLRGNAEIAPHLDALLLERIAVQHQALKHADRNLRETQAMLDKLTAPPWYPYSFIRRVHVAGADRALVRDGTATRLVGLGPDVDPAALQPCDEVFLNHNHNVLLARMESSPSWRPGEVSAVKTLLGGGRILVSARGEELLVHAPASLLAQLREGDSLLCDFTTGVALERLDLAPESRLFLEATPRESFGDIGGLDPQIRQIQEALLLHWQNPGLARKYQLPRAGSILLCGPPGTGKTLVAKAFANFVATLGASGQSLFASIKPGELHSMWYSESEKNYREIFRIAREKGTAERPVVLFFDEIDSVGSSRGHSHLRVHDNVLTALIAELDGLHERGNVLVVAATNRRDALDPALLRPGRLGDLVLEIPRPNRRAAKAIFSKHLQPEIPFARNGHGDDHAATREELIEACLAAVYAPNAEDLATIVFRDGSRRALRASELASGAVIANICRSAKRKACRRELSHAENPGLTSADLLLAAGEEFAATARGLTPQNCRQHLDLPQDLDVVKIEPVARKSDQALRFLAAA
jgi:proteasome-associated ATPase